MTAIWWPASATFIIVLAVLIAGWSPRFGYRRQRHLPNTAPAVRLELHRPRPAARSGRRPAARHRLVP